MCEESENLLSESEYEILEKFTNKLNEYKSVIYTQYKYIKMRIYLNNNISNTNKSILSLRNINIEEMSNDILTNTNFELI